MLPLLCSMATGAGAEFEVSADHDDEKKEEPKHEPEMPEDRRCCSRRAQRRLAGKLGKLGRLAAAGRISFSEAQSGIASLLCRASATTCCDGDVAPLWQQAQRRAAQQAESIYYHLRHCSVIGHPVAKARLATFLAKSEVGHSEAAAASKAHALAVDGRHRICEGDLAAGMQLQRPPAQVQEHQAQQRLLQQQHLPSVVGDEGCTDADDDFFSCFGGDGDGVVETRPLCFSIHDGDDSEYEEAFFHMAACDGPLAGEAMAIARGNSLEATAKAGSSAAAAWPRRRRSRVVSPTAVASCEAVKEHEALKEHAAFEGHEALEEHGALQEREAVDEAVDEHGAGEEQGASKEQGALKEQRGVHEALKVHEAPKEHGALEVHEAVNDHADHHRRGGSGHDGQRHGTPPGGDSDEGSDRGGRLRGTTPGGPKGSPARPSGQPGLPGGPSWELRGAEDHRGQHRPRRRAGPRLRGTARPQGAEERAGGLRLQLHPGGLDAQARARLMELADGLDVEYFPGCTEADLRRQARTAAGQPL